MSDRSLRRDELVSAYLDGAANPAEIAEVEGDDALLARVEELQAVRDAVAAPVPPLSAHQRDQLISAALGVADAESDARLEAKIVPRHRPQPLFLAVAAAVLLLAAVVGVGLFGRGSSDHADTAAEAPSPADSAAPAAEIADESMADESMAAADEATAEEEPMAEDAMEEAAAEAEAMEAAPATTTIAAAEAGDSVDEAAPEPTSVPAETEEEQRSESTTDGGEPDTDDAGGQVVDLGVLENLESLYENIGAKWSAALEDEAMADPGVCSAAVDERALEMSAETRRSFVATVGVEEPLTLDAQFVRRPDGSAAVIHAASPGCDIEIHELAGS